MTDLMFALALLAGAAGTIVAMLDTFGTARNMIRPTLRPVFVAASLLALAVVLAALSGYILVATLWSLSGAFVISLMAGARLGRVRSLRAARQHEAARNERIAALENLRAADQHQQP